MTKLPKTLPLKPSCCRQCGASEEHLKSDGKEVAVLWHSFTCIKCGARRMLPKLTFAMQDGEPPDD